MWDSLAVSYTHSPTYRPCWLLPCRGSEGDTTGNVLGLRAAKVNVVCNPPQKVVVDGEVLGFTPVEVEVVPGT